jgi:hypothetical protein
MQLATKLKPDADAPFQTALDAGYRCAELWTGPDVLDDVEAVIARARRFPLRYALHFPTRRDLTPEHLRAFVALYRGLECRAAVIHQPEFDRYAADILKLDSDVVLAVENSFLDRTQIEQWAATNTWMTLDIEHVWYLTLPDSPLPEVAAFVTVFLARHGRKVRHVHMPGYTPGRPDHQPMHAAPEFVTTMLTVLHEFRYPDFVVSEVDIEFQNIEDLRKDRELFESWRGGRSLL